MKKKYNFMYKYEKMPTLTTILNSNNIYYKPYFIHTQFISKMSVPFYNIVFLFWKSKFFLGGAIAILDRRNYVGFFSVFEF